MKGWCFRGGQRSQFVQAFRVGDRVEALLQRATASRFVLFTELVPSPLPFKSILPLPPNAIALPAHVIKITTVLEAEEGSGERV